MSVVEAHDDIRRLIDIIHYEEHDKRTESDEFKHIKDALHAQGVCCFIDNGRCDGPVEIHHREIEWSASSEVDWERVKRDLGFDHADDAKQMLPLCRRHHRGRGTGIHNMTYNAWILQKYMTPEALQAFEDAVKRTYGE